MKSPLIIPLGILALTACASDTTGYDPGVPQNTVDFGEATLMSASGVRLGNAVFNEVPEGVRVTINGAGMPPGVHAAHIHETGACTPPDFSSAGGHWNPLGRAHGRDNPDGAHMGDMPNLIVGQDGTGRLELVIQGAELIGSGPEMLDDDGAAVVIHQAADDYRTDPAGAAGPRIACGVVAAG